MKYPIYGKYYLKKKSIYGDDNICHISSKLLWAPGQLCKHVRGRTEHARILFRSAFNIIDRFQRIML
jgi:hypothetical protein